MDRFDVAIVGARCAGASLAIALSRNGLRVCLLDRSPFPSETASTHVIQPCGVQILEDLGVLDDALAAGAVPLRRLTLVNDDVRLEADIDPSRFPQPGLCVRRVTLDASLVDQAARAGAQVRTGCRVTGLVRDAAGRVIGVQTGGATVSARLVVGADGRHSTVAESIGAVEYLATPPGRLAAWAYFDGADRDGRLRLGRLGEYAFLAAPADNGLYMAAVTIDIGGRHEFRADRERHFTEGLAHWPELAALLAGAERVGPIRVCDSWHGYFRQSAGPGWVLVGDAGHFKDFTPGQGISDALRQALKLAETITAGLTGGADIDTRLRNWWRWRDQDAYEMYWLAHDMGAPGVPTPVITRMLRGIASDAGCTQRFLDVINHDLPPARLFTPGRLARAAVGALRERPDQAGATLRETAAAINAQIYRARRRNTVRSGGRRRAAVASGKMFSGLTSTAGGVSRSISA